MNTFDISDTLAPKSDQLDAVDLLGGPQTFTVESVSRGNAEQPVQIHLAEFPRPWRPGVTMRRVLAYCWGKNAQEWVGRRVTLYCDPNVTFGPEKVGGTRIKALSHIDGPQSVPVIVKKGRSGTYKVEPLTEPAAQAPTPAELAEQVVNALADATTEAEVREWGNRAHAKGLLDVQVNGETVRSHVTNRLAALSEGSAS